MHFSKSLPGLEIIPKSTKLQSRSQNIEYVRAKHALIENQLTFLAGQRPAQRHFDNFKSEPRPK